MSKQTQNLTEKWSQFIEGSEDLNLESMNIPESQKRNVAKMFENQSNDIKSERIYKDQELVEAFGEGQNILLDEAVTAGDHGTPDNIAKGQTDGAVTNIGPTVMGMARRAIPNMIAFNLAGVQPMNGPTSQVFSLRSMYGSDPLDGNAREAFHPMHAPDAMHSGRGADETFSEFSETGTYTAGDVVKVTFDAQERLPATDEPVPQNGIQYYQFAADKDLSTGTDDKLTTLEGLVVSGEVVAIAQGMATGVAELQESFNGSTDNAFNEMSFRIDKQTVEVKSRQLKAQYTIELAQDLKSVHGMDADQELSGILANEVMLEINRELVNTINAQAMIGKNGWTRTTGSSAGVFDMNDPIDVKGARWYGEALKALLSQVDKEANEIGRQTGRGTGNFIIASRNVVSAFAQTDAMVGGAAHGMQQGMNLDTNKAVFAGILANKYNVYIDQYAQHDYFTVGYKGSSDMDAGIYYSPYVPLTPLRGADSKNFQPVLGFKTRYAFSVNPLANPARTPGKIQDGGILSSIGKNSYFRRVWVKGL